MSSGNFKVPGPLTANNCSSPPPRELEKTSTQPPSRRFQTLAHLRQIGEIQFLAGGAGVVGVDVEVGGEFHGGRRRDA